MTRRPVQPHHPLPIRRRPLLLAAFALLSAACGDSPSASAPRDCGEGAMRLEVGQAAAVETDVSCVLRPQQGAEYALAWYDVRLLAIAETEFEPYLGLQDRMVLTVIEGDGSARSSADEARRWSLETTADARIVQGAGPGRALGVEGDPGPWSEGDAIRFREPICPAGCGGRVARVMDGWLVLAVDDATLGADAARATALLDEAVPYFRQHSLPMLRDAFTAVLPVNGPESGQLVVLVRGNVSAGTGVAVSDIRTDGTSTHVIMVEMEPGMDGGGMLDVLTHEVAHTFQAVFAASSVPPGQAGERPGARWGIEGGATLLGAEALRRAAGRPFAGNADFRAAPATSVERALFGHANLDNGGFVSGYNAAAGLLLDLVDRRVRAGDDLATALREVSRGAVEGWYGHARQPPRRQGLVARMQARIPGWTPEEAVLAWTLSAAADDVVDDPDFQNRAWLRVGQVEPVDLTGWAPFREMTGGSNRTEQFSREGGSPGWVRLVDTGAGVSVRVLSAPSVHWRLLRVR